MFKVIANNSKVKQRFSLNIYSLCVDIQNISNNTSNIILSAMTNSKFPEVKLNYSFLFNNYEVNDKNKMNTINFYQKISEDNLKKYGRKFLGIYKKDTMKIRNGPVFNKFPLKLLNNNNKRCKTPLNQHYKVGEGKFSEKNIKTRKLLNDFLNKTNIGYQNYYKVLHENKKNITEPDNLGNTNIKPNNEKNKIIKQENKFNNMEDLNLCDEHKQYGKKLYKNKRKTKRREDMKSKEIVFNVCLKELELKIAEKKIKDYKSAKEKKYK